LPAGPRNDPGRAGANPTLLPGERTNVDTYGVGFGLRYYLDPTVSLRFDYGWPLKEIFPGDGFDGRPHLGVIVAR
jgi:hypothetical protein